MDYFLGIRSTLSPRYDAHDVYVGNYVGATMELPLSDFYAEEPGREVSIFDARTSASAART